MIAKDPDTGQWATPPHLPPPRQAPEEKGAKCPTCHAPEMNEEQKRHHEAQLDACPNCNEPGRTGKFCESCGESLSRKPKEYCPECGARKS
jgi:hypothetical protein